MDCFLLTNQKNDNPLFKAFLGAASDAGHKINPDMNGEYQEGFGMFDTTIHNGERASVSKCFSLFCFTQFVRFPFVMDINWSQLHIIHAQLPL